MSGSNIANPNSGKHEDPDTSPYKELLRQQSDTVPGITIQSGEDPPLSTKLSYSNSDPQPTIPGSKTSPLGRKVSALRPPWKKRPTVIPEEGTDGSHILPQSPRDPPPIQRVRFPNALGQSKSTLDSYGQGDPRAPRRSNDVFQVPVEEPRFIRLVSTRLDSDATHSALKSINVVFVNMVTALPGEQDKTWIFEKTALASKSASEKAAISDGASTTQNMDAQGGGLLNPESAANQRRGSAGSLFNGSQGNRSSQESQAGGDPIPYAEFDQSARTRSSLERRAAEDVTNGKVTVLRNASLRRGVPKASGLKPSLSTTTRRVTEVKQINWLTDPEFLCKSLPEARVIHCGYRYNPVRPLTGEFYDEVCDGFLDDLTQFMLAGNNDGVPLAGPIIFVASGDAGFVIEKAIIAVAETYHPIVELIAGVIFLATPFVGSKTFCKSIGKVIGRPVLSEEKAFFGRKSDQVKELSKTFRATIKANGISIWCFQTASWKVHESDVFEIATSKLSNEYHEIGRFESADDPDYLKVMEKLLNFVNGRQLMDAVKEGELERVQAILEKKDGEGIEVDYQDVLGRTALHCAVRNNMDEVTEWLVRVGHANVRITDGEGYTALHCAVQNQSVKNVRLLLEAGADFRVQIFSSAPQRSPLDMARHLAKEKERHDPKAKYREDPIYWQLTHRPFLLEPSSYITQRKLRSPKTPTSQEIIDACNHHMLSAIEFFKGKGPVRDSRTVFEMIYSTDASSWPIETLDKALGLALQNERVEKGGTKGKETPHHTTPESVSRWYHIPANNMVWVQDFLLKLGLDVPPSSWMTENHDGPTPHSRFMRPFAKTIVAHHDGKEKKIVAFCMPFLDYESTSGRVKMKKHIRDKLIADQFGHLIQKLFVNWEKRVKNSKYPPLPDSDSDDSDFEDEDRADDWAPSTTDAPTITTSADMDEDFNAEFRKAKKSIIDAYLTHKLPVHVRRTLDQYYYYMLPDTEHRDRDQVVYRHRKKTLYLEDNQHNDERKEILVSPDVRRKKLKQVKLLMVDQLWLWLIPRDDVFKSDIVLTCFPKRWCQNNPGDSDLLETMLKFEGRAPPVTDIHSLVGLITSKCANIFDRSAAPSDIQFMEYFESAIGKAADEETSRFDDFDRQSKQLNLDETLLSTEKRAEILDQFLKIDDETKLLIDVKDIQDEISTILLVLNDQLGVLEKVVTELGNLSTFNETAFWDRHQMISANIRDFSKMEAQAKKTYDALNHLLELKTRQANAWEARFARKGGEEVARQGKTIFWFTVVTIIFLPLSFMASFMALNVRQFPRDDGPGGQGGTLWGLGQVGGLLFGISFAMSIPLVILAFNVSTVQHFLAAHLFTAFLTLLHNSAKYIILKWRRNFSIRAWLPKLLSRLQLRGWLNDPLPGRWEAWKDREQAAFDTWKLGLDRPGEGEEERRRRVKREMEGDEEAVFEAGDSEVSSGSESEADEGDEKEVDHDGTVGAEREGRRDGVGNEEAGGEGEGEGDAKWDILGLRNRGGRLKKSFRRQGRGGSGDMGDVNV